VPGKEDGREGVVAGSKQIQEGRGVKKGSLFLLTRFRKLSAIKFVGEREKTPWKSKRKDRNGLVVLMAAGKRHRR